MVVDLLNVVQGLSDDVLRLKEENQALRDEINRLKGEHGLPKFKSEKSSKPVQPKSAQKTTSKSLSEKAAKGKKSDRVKIDRVEVVPVDRSLLPSDAVFKGYTRLVEQNVRLVRENVAYDVEVFYSKSEGRSYQAPMPVSYRGKFGYDLVCLTQYLHSFGDMTQGRLELMYRDLGVLISSGTISNLLVKHGQWAVEERDAILRAGLQGSSFSQMDATRTVEKGQIRNTQIICADYFKVFYTRPGRSRVDVISALQGMDIEQTKLRFNRIALHFMTKFRVNKKDQLLIASLIRKDEPLELEELWNRLAVSPDLAQAKQARRSKINDALALGHYYTQTQYPVVDFLLTDDALEYKTVSRRGHALCWIHDLRYYRKMVAQSAYHQDLLHQFINKYWIFYEKLKVYRKATAEQQNKLKNTLTDKFDELFGAPCDYAVLKTRMKRTFKNRDKLLTFLDNPDIPLHNNSAERGARRVVRKRDISLHTWSPQGTRAKDSFLSVIETARKLGINILEYITARLQRNDEVLSLALRVETIYA